MASRPRKTPMVFQMEATECGAACLAMICAHWGKHVSLDQMRIDVGVSRDGASAGNISRAARRMGLECDAYYLYEHELPESSLPCILLWNSSHFVVLDGFDGNTALINDPALGRRRVDPEELQRCFSGPVLEFRPTDAFTAERKSHTLPSLLKSRFAKTPGLLAACIACGLLMLVPGLAAGTLICMAVDGFMGTGIPEQTRTLCCFFGASVALQLALLLLQSKARQRMSNRLTALSNQELISHLLELPMSFFSQRMPVELAQRVGRSERIDAFLADAASSLAADLLQIIAFSIVLLVWSVPLAALGFACIAAYSCIVGKLFLTARESAMKQSQDAALLIGRLCEGLRASTSLKAAGAETAFAQKLAQTDDELDATYRRERALRNVAKVLPGALLPFFDALLLIAGGVLACQGALTAGSLLAFVVVFGLLLEPVADVGRLARKAQSVMLDAERVEDIMRFPTSSAPSETSDGSLQKLSGDLSVQEAAFAYSMFAKPVVHGITFEATPGMTIGIVGPSGSGKSSIVRIISGLYKPTSGLVCYSGKVQEEMPEAVFHSSVTAVDQHPVFFQGTVRDNLTLWNRAILEADIIRAADDACILQTIQERPGCLDAAVSENALNFSGGQRQRLALARALSLNPSILVLDEATSALDVETETRVMRNIRRRGCTCIVVAHRLATIRDADQILVVDDGAIVERGTHAELLEQRGLYWKLCEDDKGACA